MFAAAGYRVVHLHCRGFNQSARKLWNYTEYMKIKISFATLLTLALFTYALAQMPDKAKLDQFFDRLAEKNKAMGSLTIAKDGNVLYSRAIGYGQVNGTEKKPLTAASRFRIGSITKMFTAAMIFQLAEERKLKLTDALDKFFPQIPNAQKITIAQILGHRSGIHDSILDKDLRGSSKSDAITKDEMLALSPKARLISNRTQSILTAILAISF